MSLGCKGADTSCLRGGTMDTALCPVRHVLRRAVALESSVAGFISSVCADGKATPSVQINQQNRLACNQGSIEVNVRTQEEVCFLVMHELMHPLCNHYVYATDRLTNIACDAVVSASISRFFPD